MDWTGNNTSVSATLGASNLSEKDRAEKVKEMVEIEKCIEKVR